MKLAPVLVVATLVLTGCSALQVGPRDTGGKPRVVASFYPLAYVAQRIGGPHVQVQDLTTPGMDPHDYELTVQQTFDVADADVMFYDRGVQATVDDAVDETSPRRVVDAARVAPPVGDNVHVWVDPLRLDAIATEFTHAMAAADPAHARSYRTRDRSLHRDLTSLDRAF